MRIPDFILHSSVMSRNLLIEPVKASVTADEVDIQCCESDVESEYDKTL